MSKPAQSNNKYPCGSAVSQKDVFILSDISKVKRIIAKIPKWLYYAVPAFILSVILTLLAKNTAGFAEWYSTNIYPFFVGTVGRFTSLLPFSLCEILLYTVIILAAVGVVYTVIRFIRGKGRRRQLMMSVLAVVISFAVSVFFVFTLFCGINYSRTPFSTVSGFTVETYTAQELADLCVYILKNANDAAEKIETDDTLIVKLDGKINFDEECKKAMNALGEKYDSLSGFYPNAKAVIASEGMSYMKILGMYTPFTIEANYNASAPDFAKPFTLCHELSHLKGFMREDEANFIAYLACTGSDNAYVQYAGWVYALIYAANALYSAAGSDIYNELMSYADDKIIAELNANSEYWKRYETPVAAVATSVNDTYLKSQGQSDGKKSYGRFVDLMISYRKMQTS